MNDDTTTLASFEPVIHRAAAAVEYRSEERCFITELANHANDPALSIARARVSPGETTRWHRLHGIAERYLIVAGRGTVEVGELAPTSVVPGDVVVIPPGLRQRIRDDGDEDLLFLAMCTPRFVWSAYEDIDAAQPA
ncbi:cupin domain-containing protein [Solimonas terrae]|uniref:Cupin domain-containing protein n=1 Tax=Solimonas terrae TaxID=1396819 RepID=A0A6M2BQX0_9GAMM|nr:cupin domain-containing protein [Solimonas terrae]NGY04710.1 cupin domain-containing protein [Solimonas terrae]